MPTLMRPSSLVCPALVAAALSSAAGAAERDFTIPRHDGAIEVDARLDEPAWADALTFELRYETRPGENVEPPVTTECRMFFSASHLYYGCNASDPDPDSILARYSDRDTSAFYDDTIGLAIDPFADQNRAYILDVNPLGVQNDRIYTEANGRSDSSWDAIWSSAGRLTETGYMVEVAIPFSSLQFPRSSPPEGWGFNFRRYHPRDAYRRIALVPYDRDDACRTCQHAHLLGLTDVDPGRDLEVTPTLTGIRRSQRDGFPDGSLVSDDPDFDPGLTVSWGVKPNVNLSGTLNPDFSQVEADVAQLSVNQQFALFFPERRPFFLEGADVFSTQIRAVHTRTLADPIWGGKLVAEEGKHTIGAFVARDELTNLLLPGAEGSTVDSLDLETTSSVARYRYTFGTASTVGLLATDRSGGDYENRLAGIDTRLRLTTHDTLQFQALTSRTRYPGEIASRHALPTDTLSDQAYSLNYRHARRSWHARATLQDFGDDFRADIGFIPQVGFKKAIVGGGYQWFGDDDRWFTEISIGGDWDRTETQSGQLLEEETEFWVNYQGWKRSGLGFGGGIRDRVFSGVPFDQSYGWFSFFFWPQANFGIGFDAGLSDAIDLAGVRPGEQRNFSPNLQWNPGKHVQLQLFHNRRSLDLEEGRLFTAELSELRLVYQINTRAFVRLIAQYTDIERNPELAVNDVEAESQDLFGQLLLSYKLNPRTAVFLGYSASYLETSQSSLIETGNTLFLKLGYAWQP